MKHALLTFSGLLVFVGCKDKEEPEPEPTPATPQVKLSVQPYFGSEELDLDSTYTLDAGWDVQFTDIKFFVTDCKNGSNVLTSAARFDYREYGTLLCLVNGSASNFGSLTGIIGVPASINHDDPSALPSNSPLNIVNVNGMHWSWNTGYIFITVEGKADTIVDGTALFDHTFTYHIGMDANLGTFNFPAVTWVGSSTLKQAWLNLDMKHVFDHPTNPIDITSEYITHSGGGQETLTQKFLSNFQEALTTP